MRILVTGGAGFIGSHIVDYYLKQGDEVWAIDDLTTGKKQNLKEHAHLRFSSARLEECPELEEAACWAERIFHAAATVGMQNVIEHPLDTLRNNLTTLDALLQAMRKSEARFCFLSSSGVYWNSKMEAHGFEEETPLIVHAQNYRQEPYSLSKISGEVMSLAFAAKWEKFCTIARIFNTVGVRQTGKYGMVMPRLIGQALKGEPLTIFGDGHQTRSFIHVHDTVQALALLVETAAANGEIINVGNDYEISIVELAKTIKRVLRSPSELTFVPYREAYGFDFIDVRHRRPCIDKLKKLTGFEPKWTLEQTIVEIATSLREGALL